MQHLIRIRTRMMSCVWIMLAAAMPFLHPLGKPAIAAVCLSLSYLLLFRCYQLHRPEIWVFHSFMFLGLGSFCTPAMLPMALLFYIYLAGFLRSLTWKGIWAGLIGLVSPYWCWLVWCLLTDDLDTFTTFCTSMFDVTPIAWKNIQSMPLQWLASWGYIALLSVVGMIHYLNTNYNDKIKVRMMLYVYVSQTILLLALLALQPTDFQVLTALLLATGSPLIAHYFSLTGSWISNTFFVLSVIGLIALSYINLWMPSFNI